MLTVRELLFESGFPLRPLTGESGLDKAIEGIHLSDLPDPVPWMTRGMALLTAGPSFAACPDEGIRLLDRLTGIEAAALGVAVGHYMEHVPQPVIDHGRRVHIPVFEIESGLPMRTIMSYVYNSLASTDLHRLRRTVALQNRLLDLAAEERGADELLASVASLLEMPVLLLDGRCELLAAAGDADAQQLADCFRRAYFSLERRTGPMGVIEDEDCRLYYRDVTLFGRVERVLAAASPTPASEFVDTALSFVQRLIALELLRDRDALAARRRARARLLQDFLSNPQPDERLEAQVADQGIDLRRPWRLALCAVQPRTGQGELPADIEPSETEERLLETVESFFAGRRIPFLCSPQRSAVAALFTPSQPDEDEARASLQELAVLARASLPDAGIYIGCSAAVNGVGAGPRAARQAQEALSGAARGEDPDDIVLFDSVREGLLRLLTEQSDETLTRLVQETIAPLVQSDALRHTDLVHTLRVLFESRHAVQETADHLRIHRNTLQKRLRRIERLLNVDLDRLDNLLELYLGLRAADLIGM